jgi:hypothetical protein
VNMALLEAEALKCLTQDCKSSAPANSAIAPREY